MNSWKLQAWINTATKPSQRTLLFQKTDVAIIVFVLFSFFSEQGSKQEVMVKEFYTSAMVKTITCEQI